MSRDLILLRHSHTEPPAAGVDDAGRHLTAQGCNEAEAAAQWLKAHDIKPSHILSSPAARAHQTAQIVQAALGGGAVIEEARIYEATPGDLIEVFDDYADGSCVLLVGHNPGLENLVGLLSEGVSDASRGMPPAAIAWLRVSDHGELEPGKAQVLHFWWP